ncbi:PREDICTED: probable membrane-associated kinase regulator 6 [Ipomoea nil]|uniref:probable membrane-associated kinase regulator 6 n=1 Tax=Ipomoea nil TaxID=35883 RepID=UPI000900BFC6|nr:PREDICTED: probable membrane-associated kinase regulator 6 [Ipomoea nil]
MDPTFPLSWRFFSVSVNLPTFSNFNFLVSESPLTLLHANGFLAPLFAQPIKYDSFDCTFDSPEQPTKQDQVHSFDEIRCATLKRCERLSRRIFCKYLDVIMPICRNCEDSDSRTDEEALERRRGRYMNFLAWFQPTRQSAVTYSIDNWHRFCDSECSIHEAVLHCKKPIVGDK